MFGLDRHHVPPLPPLRAMRMWFTPSLRLQSYRREAPGSGLMLLISL